MSKATMAAQRSRGDDDYRRKSLCAPLVVIIILRTPVANNESESLVIDLILD